MSERIAASQHILSWHSKDMLGRADNQATARSQAFWLARLKTAA
jgi:hypothetical protein